MVHHALLPFSTEDRKIVASTTKTQDSLSKPETRRTDNRRWLGLLSSSNGRARHSHNLPIPSKVPVKVKQDICEALRKYPTKTAKEL